MSYEDKHCHCEECDEKKHCSCDCDCDLGCPDPSLCGCGECDELRNEFVICSPHYFHTTGDEPNSFTLIVLFGRPVPRTAAGSLGVPFAADIERVANRFQVDGKFLCPFLVWGRANNGQLVLVRLAPGTPKPVTVIESPSPECKAYPVIVTITTFPGLTNLTIGATNSDSTRGTNPFNRNRNLHRRNNIR